MKRHTNMSTNENNPLIMIHPEERKRTHTVWQFQIKQEKVSYAYDECLLIIFLIISTKQLLIIVMYNLALTLHLHALSLASTVSSSSSKKIRSSKSMKNKIKKLFVRSKKLYELTLQMHLEDDHSSDDNDDPLFTLALTNNLGLIYRLLNERAQSNTCFKNMFSTMMYLLDCKFDSHSIKEWDGLFSNAMDILFKHTYEVAAAAA
mmetsp:Transcript_25952/g.29521  ORF Transcript_25952/g.29521 Transcript_25952/m.29521 type:complete len:205 (-) Transcript_25952:113-727(-)